jgi:predicted membrane-bound spermidine synthase
MALTILNANYPNIVDQKGELHSIYPCTGYLTFGVWLYLVPQFKPKSVLMLGYGGGTAAGLIRMFYGDVPITAVDMADCSEFNFYDVNLIQNNAKNFVKTCGQYDVVIIDLYGVNEAHSQSWVFESDFVQDLKQVANYIILHAIKGDDVSEYDKVFNRIRRLSTNDGTEYEPQFYYYEVNFNPSLPVR